MKEATKENLSELLTSNETVIIEFSAEWCGPCKAMAPILASIDEEYDDVSVYKVDADEQAELCGEFGVRSIPTTFYYKNGQLIDKTVGSRSKAELLQRIKK